MDEFIKKYGKASLLQKNGLFEKSKDMFSELLKKSDNKIISSNIYYHLAQMEPDSDVKKDMLRMSIELNPEQRMANNLLSLLTENNINRLRKDKTGVIRQFFERFPLNIQIQTVSTCNAKCKMCPYHGSWQKHHPGTMDSKTFLHIVNLLENIPLGKLCLYLENEPFLDKDLFEKIKIVKNRLKYKFIELSTNLSMLNEEKIQNLFELMKNTPHEIWISWHGIDEKSYKEIMGFDFYKNRENLINYFKITKGELKTSINTIVGSKLNDKRITAEKRAKDFFYNIIRESAVDININNINIKTFYYHDRAGNIEEKITNDKALKMIGKLKPTCPRIKEWLHFVYDGDIILCCMDYQKETVMGNVNDFGSLEELLNSERFTKYQKMALGSIDSPDDFICKRCTSPGG